MQKYQIIKMNDYSNHQIDQIRMLEQLCKTFDQSSLRVGIESLVKIDGDEAFLCQIDDHLIGFISWYTSDGIEANINGMVHPDFRRHGVFRELMKRAASEMLMQDIQTFRFRIPSNSEPGIDCIRHLGASFSTSEFSMILNQLLTEELCLTGLKLQLEEEQDLKFMIKCSSQAFGDSESWTRNYFNRTREPERVTYIAIDSLTPIGMIRVNYIQDTAVIHDFCVLPSYQGRGYGREILARVVKLLLEQKCSQVRLGVVTQNRRALKLYQLLGFEASAESHYYVISTKRII